MQLIRVFADATDRLADAIVRTFHDYVHERFRAQGLTGPELLAASEAHRRLAEADRRVLPPPGLSARQP